MTDSQAYNCDRQTDRQTDRHIRGRPKRDMYERDRLT